MDHFPSISITYLSTRLYHPDYVFFPPFPRLFGSEALLGWIQLLTAIKSKSLKFMAPGDNRISNPKMREKYGTLLRIIVSTKQIGSNRVAPAGCLSIPVWLGLDKLFHFCFTQSIQSLNEILDLDLDRERNDVVLVQLDNAVHVYLCIPVRE